LKKTLVLGIGNDILTDDGIGPRLVKDIQEHQYRENVHFKNAFLGGLEILELIRDFEKVIFIDAIITKDGIPGTVYHFMIEDFQETLHLSNLHDVNFLTSLELGKRMNLSLPSEIHIIAIEIVEDRVFSDHFSPGIEEQYPKILGSVITILRTLIQ
jgi:hydrogenase maturation protease